MLISYTTLAQYMLVKPAGITCKRYLQKSKSLYAF